MRAENPIESMASALYHAVLVDLPEVEYMHQTPQDRKDNRDGVLKKRRPYSDEVEVCQFLQTWGSTALGFGGIGGQAITTAYTTVVVSPLRTVASVYFAGRHAYTKPFTPEFVKDMAAQHMSDVAKSSKYNP